MVAGAYGADPAAIAHDAVKAALAKNAQYLFVDTAGRLHTKSNLMKELEKLHRVMSKLLPGAPHETLLVLDATTGMISMRATRVVTHADTLGAERLGVRQQVAPGAGVLVSGGGAASTRGSPASRRGAPGSSQICCALQKRPLGQMLSGQLG